MSTSYTPLAAALRQAGIHTGALLVFEMPEEGAVGSAQDHAYPALTADLQSMVGMDGTLVVPTCTAAEGRPKPTFDPQLSPSEMGPFSEFFRQQAGVLRSHNPTHSIAALGPLAEKLVSGHRSAAGRPTPWGEGAFGKGSPWDRLYEQDAWWAVVDGTWTASPCISFIQALYAEHHAGITKRPCFPRFSVSALVQELRRRQVIRQVEGEHHTIHLFQTRQIVDAALEILDVSPHMLHPSAEFSQWLKTVEQINQHGYTLVGVAKAIITPPIPALRWEGKQMTGVYRDLCARVVGFSYQDQHIALVLCDLLGISSELVGRIRARVSELIGLPPETIQIACTHAHSTPDTIGAGYEDADYLDLLTRTVADAICRAFSHQQPARVGWSCVPIRGIARSRRMRLRDGSVFTTRYGVPSTWRVDPDIIVGEGEINPDLTVIKVEALDGEVMAVISNFACHASVALLSPNLSGDFPGEAMDVLETVLGPQSVALCTTGAAADVDPTLEMPFWGPRSDKMAQHLGRILAAQVLETVERTEVTELTDVAAAQETVHLELRPEWLQLLVSEQDRMQQEFSTGWALSSVVQRLLDEHIIHTEVQGLRLNRLVLLGLPGEVFVQTGQRLKDSTVDATVTVVELANDNIGYIPTHAAFAEGGYEVGQHFWGRITPDGTDKLEAAARRVLIGLAMRNTQPAD